MHYRIETKNAEYNAAEIVGERNGCLGIRYAGMKDTHAGRRGEAPLDNWKQVFRVDWVLKIDIRKIVRLDQR